MHVSVYKKSRNGQKDKQYTAIIKFGRTHAFQRGTGKTEYQSALRVAQQLGKKIETKELPYHGQELLTLDDLFTYWWHKYASLQRSAETMRDRASMITKILSPDMLVKELDDESVSDLAYVLANGGKLGKRSPATVNRHLDVLAKAHNFSQTRNMEWRNNKINQFQFINWGDHRGKEPKERVVFVSTTVAKQIWELLPPHIQLPYLFAIYTGGRLNEIETLTKDKIYWEGFCCEVKTKGGGTRILTLGDIAIEILKKALLSRKENDVLVFDMTNRRKLWESARAAVGRPDLKWHDLRHVAATWLQSYGQLELRAVSKALGHENLATTKKYTHVADSALKKAFDSFPDLIEDSDEKPENVVDGPPQLERPEVR